MSPIVIPDRRAEERDGEDASDRMSSGNTEADYILT
jgi:hypothetical protein